MPLIPKQKKGRYYAHKVDQQSSLSVNNRAFYFDEDQNLWSGSSQGLFRYNRKTDEFESVFGRNDDGSITRIQSLYIDRSKNLWIGTEISGLPVVDLKQKKIRTCG